MRFVPNILSIPVLICLQGLASAQDLPRSVVQCKTDQSDSTWGFLSFSRRMSFRLSAGRDRIKCR
jgi:hypothetical protein